MKKITVWAAYIARESKTHPSYFTHNWEHNHIEDGWAEGLTPTPKFPSQKSWSGLTWKKQYCYMTDESVVVPASQCV